MDHLDLGEYQECPVPSAQQGSSSAFIKTIGFEGYGIWTVVS